MALDPRIKAVGFDMDGTFMHTKVDYVKLANIVFDEFRSLGVPESVISQDGYKMSMDSGITWLRENGLSEYIPGINERIGNRATEIEMENSNIAIPYPGALEVLRELKKREYKVGILTRGGHMYAAKILNMFNVFDEFDAIIARDDYPEEEAKPSPLAMEHLAEHLGVSSDEILYLGDGLVDYLTADAAGSPFIGVETGSNNSRDAWIKKTQNRNIRTIGSIADLLGIIRDP